MGSTVVAKGEGKNDYDTYRDPDASVISSDGIHIADAGEVAQAAAS